MRNYIFDLYFTNHPFRDQNHFCHSQPTSYKENTDFLDKASKCSKVSSFCPDFCAKVTDPLNKEASLESLDSSNFVEATDFLDKALYRGSEGNLNVIGIETIVITWALHKTTSLKSPTDSFEEADF